MVGNIAVLAVDAVNTARDNGIRVTASSQHRNSTGKVMDPVLPQPAAQCARIGHLTRSVEGIVDRLVAGIAARLAVVPETALRKGVPKGISAESARA